MQQNGHNDDSVTKRSLKLAKQAFESTPLKERGLQLYQLHGLRAFAEHIAQLKRIRRA